MTSPLIESAEAYERLLYKLESAGESAFSMVSDAEGDEPPHLGIIIMGGRIQEIVMADELITEFDGDEVALAVYINMFLHEALERYADALGAYMKDEN